MIGSFLTRGLVTIFGYVYPAYECFKSVEKNKPDIEDLRFWCQYWILVAMLTVFERVGDAFVSWVPMYSEAKLAFYIYLWYPKTMGTTYVYDSFFRPYITKHEADIDRNLLELRTRAGDYFFLYWQRAASYAQTRVFDILQYVAAQSTPRQRPVQTQQQSIAMPQQPAPPTTQRIAPVPPSPTVSSASSTQHQKNVSEKDKAPEAPVARPKSTSALGSKNPSANLSVTESSSSSSQPASSEAESSMQVDSAPATGIETATSLPKETVLEDTVRVTRLRLRKNRSVPTP